MVEINYCFITKGYKHLIKLYMPPSPRLHHHIVPQSPFSFFSFLHLQCNIVTLLIYYQLINLSPPPKKQSFFFQYLLNFSRFFILLPLFMMNQLGSQIKLGLFSLFLVSSAFGFLWFLKIVTFLVLLHLWTVCVSGLSSFCSLDFV